MELTKKMASLMSGKKSQIDKDDDDDDEAQLIMEDYKNTKAKLSQAMKEVESLNNQLEQSHTEIEIYKAKLHQKDDIIDCLIKRITDNTAYCNLFKLMKEEVEHLSKSNNAANKELKQALSKIEGYTNKLNRAIINKEAKAITKEIMGINDPQINEYQHAILILTKHIQFIQASIPASTHSCTLEQTHLPDINDNRWNKIKRSLLEMKLIKETELDWFDDQGEDKPQASSPFIVKSEVKSGEIDLPPQALGFLESKQKEQAKEGWDNNNEISFDE